MKVREKSPALIIIECICHAMLIYPLITVLWYMFADQDCIKPIVLISVLLSEAFLYFIRRKIHNSLVLFLVTVLYAVVMFGMSSIFSMPMLIFIGIAMAMWSLAVVFLENYADLEKPSWGFAILIILVGICVWLTDTPKLLTVFYISEAVYIFAIIIYNNLEAANKFIWENRSTSFLYVSQIKYANYLITTVLAILTIAAAVICSFTFTPVLNLAKGPMLKLVEFFINGDLEMPPPIDLGGGGEEAIGEISQMQQGGGSIITLIVSIVLVVVALIIIATIVIFIIKIIKELSVSSRDGDIKEYIMPSDKDDEVEGVDRGDKETFNDKPAKAIRKIYKKKIKAGTKNGGSSVSALTPDEQMNFVGLDGEAAEKFASLYRKARYSNEECSEQDVESMKKML